MTRGAGIGPNIGPDVEDFVPVGTDREVAECLSDWRQERDEARLTGDYAPEIVARRRLSLSLEAQERRLEYLARLEEKCQ